MHVLIPFYSQENHISYWHGHSEATLRLQSLKRKDLEIIFILLPAATLGCVRANTNCDFLVNRTGLVHAQAQGFLTEGVELTVIG